VVSGRPPSGLAEKANRVMKAIMEMGKIEIAALNKATSLTA